MPSEKAKPRKAPARPRGRPPIVRDFYGSAMETAQAIALTYANDVEGLDKEIALLRTKLREILKMKDGKGKKLGDRPEGIELMIRGMHLLARLVATRYRLSAEAQEDLASKIAGLIDGVGAQFYPEGRDGG